MAEPAPALAADPDGSGRVPKAWVPLFAFLGSSLCLALPSWILWWRSIGLPLRVTAFEYDYFLGLLGSDYARRTLPFLLFGKIIHALLLGLAGWGFWRYLIAPFPDSEARPTRTVLLAGLAAAIYLSAHAWMSPDVFFYFGTGWLETHYGGNPYVHVIAQAQGFQSEPMFANIIPAWLLIVTPYGPLFIKICSLVAWLSGGDQTLALLLFKLLCATVHALNCALVWRIAGQLGACPRRSMLAWALNPVVLFAFLAANHNDVFLLLCLLAATSLTLEGRDFGAAVVLGLGVGVKYMPLFIFPFFLLHFTQKLTLPRAVLRATTLALVFAIVAILPSLLYPNGPANFLRLLKGQDQLMRNFLYIEPLRILQQFTVVSRDTVLHLKWVYKGLFVLAYAGIWIRGLCNRGSFDFEALMKGCLSALVVYFLVGSPEIHEWYLPWFFMFTFFSRDRRRFQFGMVLSTCILPFVIFEVRSPWGILMAARYAFFGVIWIAAWAYLFRRESSPAESPLFARA